MLNITPRAVLNRMNRRNVYKMIAFSLGAFVVSSCTSMCERRHEKMSPEEVVEAYLEVSLNMTDVSQREQLMRYTTGHLKGAIAQVSDDTIRQAYIERNLTIERYSVVQRRNRTPRETEITFELVYRDLGYGDESIGDEEAPVVVTENTVSVVRERDLWLIRDVLGKKTSIEFPILAEDEIRPGAEPELD